MELAELSYQYPTHGALYAFHELIDCTVLTTCPKNYIPKIQSSLKKKKNLENTKKREETDATVILSRYTACNNRYLTPLRALFIHLV